MKLSDVKRDVVAIEQGAWVENIPEMGNLRLKTRGVNNADWRKLFSQLVAAVPREKRRGNQIDPKELDRIYAICLHKAGLQDWDNITDGPDEEHQTKVAFNADLAWKMLTEPEYANFYAAAMWAANEVGAQSVLSEEVVKNSSSVSSGT